MTTIAACFSLGTMAADTRVVLETRDGRYRHAYCNTKLLRTGHWIVGCAGYQEDIDAFFSWLPDRRKRRRRVRHDFEALLLSRDRLLYVADDEAPVAVRVDFMAIGTGAGFALAAMGALQAVGEPPDPRIAVDVACLHDADSAPPIDFLRWKTDARTPAS